MEKGGKYCGCLVVRDNRDDLTLARAIKIRAWTILPHQLGSATVAQHFCTRHTTLEVHFRLMMDKILACDNLMSYTGNFLLNTVVQILRASRS
jgi:hypothetical protein